MSERKGPINPTALIGVGVCFMGAGVALSAALHAEGASGVGTGLIGLGVIFLALGVARKRKLESDGEGDEDGIQTP